MKKLSLEDAFGILKKRKTESNKGDYGTLTSLVGCTNYRGAALLSTMGALRTGVGIVRVASVEEVIQTVASALPEAIFMPLRTVDSFDMTDLPKSTALLCGCGLGRSKEAEKAVKNVVANARLPLVLDADGLNNILPEELDGRNREILITPHMGEFSRLIGKTVEELKSCAEEYASRFAQKHNVTVMLKDHNTLIATPEGKLSVSCNGNPGLARGGSGDILAGMAGSFAAQGYNMYESAVMASVFHGSAADRTAKRLSMQAMLPHDILTDLSEIFKERGR